MGKGAPIRLLLVVFVCWAAQTVCGETTLRVGYFPNLTHAHALIAQNMAAEGNGWFERHMPGTRIEWVSFNAGPSAMESVFAGAVDLTYVGPNPILNAFIRSQGGVRVLSGAVRGGAGLVVPKGSGLSAPGDFAGKSIATPQLGNTQDIACRYWLIEAGLKVTMTGGDVTVIPSANPSLLPLFSRRQVDAVWTVEPWLSRLEMEADGELIYSEAPETSVTTVLAGSAGFIAKHPDAAAGFARAHRALTDWIRDNPEEAGKRVAAELSRQMRREFPLDLVVHAWPRLVFDNAIGTGEFAHSLRAARTAGFIKGEADGDLSGLVAAE